MKKEIKNYEELEKMRKNTLPLKNSLQTIEVSKFNEKLIMEGSVL